MQRVNEGQIKASRNYIEKSATNNCFWILKQIKSVTLKFDSKRNGYIALLDATANFVNLRQSQTQSVVDYVDSLKGYADTIEYHGGLIVVNYKLVPWMSDEGTPPWNHGGNHSHSVCLHACPVQGRRH